MKRIITPAQWTAAGIRRIVAGLGRIEAYVVKAESFKRLCAPTKRRLRTTFGRQSGAFRALLRQFVAANPSVDISAAVQEFTELSRRFRARLPAMVRRAGPKPFGIAPVPVDWRLADHARADDVDQQILSSRFGTISVEIADGDLIYSALDTLPILCRHTPQARKLRHCLNRVMYRVEQIRRELTVRAIVLPVKEERAIIQRFKDWRELLALSRTGTNTSKSPLRARGAIIVERAERRHERKV